jgi:beta-glucosidase
VTLPVPPDSNGNATSIAFLGAATNVDDDGATGQATVTFTDGHAQTVTITFSDWTLNNGDATPAAGTRIVVNGGHRANVDDGTQDPAPAYLYATVGTPLRDNGQTLAAAGVQVASVTLPDNPDLAIFGISIN